MSITHKKFIKLVISDPEKIDKELVKLMLLTYTHEEIFHIILLMLSVKNRLQLNFLALRIFEAWKNID